MAGIYENFANSVSNIMMANAAAQAEAARQRGQIWGQSLNALGQQISNLPTQYAQLQQMKNQQQIQQMQLAGMQRAQQGEMKANQIISGFPRNPDNTFDTGTLGQQFAAAGVPLEQQEKYLTSLDKINGVITTHNQQIADHRADVANTILSAHGPTDLIDPQTVQLGVAAAKAGNLITPDDEKAMTQALGSNPDPSFPRQLLMQIRNRGSQFQKQEFKTKGPGDVIYNAATGQTVGSQEGGAFKDENDALSALTNPNDPRQAQAQAWLNARKQFTGSPDAQMDAEAQRILTKKGLNQPLTPEENATLNAYTQRKLIGPEAAAAAATTRLMMTEKAASDRQAAAQAFTEGQAGRKEYSEKVATPYQTALASSQTLRDVVSAAQGGNKIGASLQSLETTMAAIRAQGLNRINTAEIGVPASAGSAWDRIQGWFGKATEGQPVPANIQKDMLQFADILDKQATSKYQKGRQSILSTYKGINLPDETVAPSLKDTRNAVPVPPDVGAALKDSTPGRRYRVNGKIYQKLADGTIQPE